MKCCVAFRALLLLLVNQTASVVYHACNPQRAEYINNKNVFAWFGNWNGKFYQIREIKKIKSDDTIVVEYFDDEGKEYDVEPKNVKIITRRKPISPRTIEDCTQKIFCAKANMWGHAEDKKKCKAAALKWKGDDDDTKETCSEIAIMEAEVFCDAANECAPIGGDFPVGMEGTGGADGCTPGLKLTLGNTCTLQCSSGYTGTGSGVYTCNKLAQKPETNFVCREDITATTAGPGVSPSPTVTSTSSNGGVISTTTGVTSTAGPGVTSTTDPNGVGDSDKGTDGDDDDDAKPDSGGAVAAIVVILVLVALGVAGFLVYWFVIRKRRQATKTPTKDVEMGEQEYSDTLRTNVAKQVSKPVLQQVNGSNVDPGHSDSDDSTVDEDDEPPALPSQPKPPVPTLSPDTPRGKSLRNDYSNDYNPKGVPKRAPSLTDDYDVSPVPKRAPSISDDYDASP